jgi:hypothetical protein
MSETSGRRDERNVRGEPLEPLFDAEDSTCISVEALYGGKFLAHSGESLRD